MRHVLSNEDAKKTSRYFFPTVVKHGMERVRVPKVFRVTVPVSFFKTARLPTSRE